MHYDVLGEFPLGKDHQFFGWRDELGANIALGEGFLVHAGCW